MYVQNESPNMIESIPLLLNLTEFVHNEPVISILFNKPFCSKLR